MRCVVDNPEDDVMGALGSTMASKAAGKDIAHEAEGREGGEKGGGGGLGQLHQQSGSRGIREGS